MDPLEPTKNDESGGLSKRRISSILKAPRKSIRCPEPEQQENVVECAKPVEKRNSRRVSFAPANNVLLFSNDLKNASPARSPLQDLMTTTAAATQNRVQVALTEDGIQQITGMETLLNAPLHASQQRDKVNFDTGDDFGEKTVMFSTDDAFMDMTHSQTINIANDAELLADISLKNYEVLPTSREKTVMFTAGDGSMDMTLNHTVNVTSGSGSLPTSRSIDLNAEKRNIVSSVPCLDPEFENFLASIFKPSGPSVDPEMTRMTPPAGASSEQTNGSQAQIKTQRPDVDKENQAPTFVSAVMEKSLNTHMKIDQSSYGSVLCPKSDVSMDITEAKTGRIQGFPDDEDSFPTQEMYLDHRVSQTAEKTKQQQSSRTLASFNPKDKTTWKNPSLHASHQRHTVNLDTKDEYRQKTIMFSAGDEFMDMTQSHTVNITNGALAPPIQNRTHGKMDNASSLDERRSETCGLPRSSANGLDLGFKDFRTGLSKSAPGGNPEIARMVTPTAASSKEAVDTNGCLSQLKTDVHKEKQSLNTTTSFGDSLNGGAISPENDVSMDMTEAQTGYIVGWDDDDMYPHYESLKRAEKTSGQKNSEAPGSSNSAGTETSLKPSLKTKVQGHQVKFDAEDDCRDRTVRFSADVACMDVTQSHTISIATDLAAHDMYAQSSHLKKVEMTLRQQHSEAMASSNYKGMETSLAASLTKKVQGHQVKFDAEDNYREKTVRFTADEACMDVTQCHTVNIVSDLEMHSHQNVDFLPACGEKTVRFSANDAAMDVTQSHTVNIATGFDPRARQNVDFLPACGEKTVRFSANDAAMDVTQSHTVNIATGFDLHSHQNVNFIPACGEKTVRFSANDAVMDVTQSHTVNIATGFNPHSHQNVDFIPSCGEKTVRFASNDAAMDVTQSHTVNIVSDLDLHSHQNVDFLPSCGEKTVRFASNAAAMDVTQSHTVNIATGFNPHSHQNVDFIPSCGEKTVRFASNAAAMDVTQSHTVNIASNSVKDSVLPHRDSNILSPHENMDFPLSMKKKENETCPDGNRSSSAQTLDPGFKNSQSKMSGPWANPVITKAVPATLSPDETVDTNGVLDQHKIKKPHVDTEREAPGFVSAVTETVNKTMADCPEDDVRVAMTEAQPDHVLGQTCTDEPPPCTSSTKGLFSNSVNLSETKATSQKNNGSSNPDCEEITNCKGYLDSNETDNKEEPELRSQTCSPESVDHVDAVPSRKSRRISFADLHTKIRRLSHMVNTAPDTIATDSCTAPLPQLEHYMDQNSKDKTQSLPVMEPELEMASVENEENTQAQCIMEGEQTTTDTTTPFNLKTKQLMSRLSVGSFKPKLPQRSKPDDPKKVNSVGQHTRTITDVTNQLCRFDGDVSDIYDEELGSCEDMSEMLDTRSPHKATAKVSPPQEFYMDGPLDDNVFEEDFISAGNGKKRLLPVDENNMEDEKRMKACTETATDFDMGSRSHLVECDSNITSAPGMTTQTTDESNSSHTASIRCEVTFESTFKQSLFESQLEDYANDMQRKFDDGTITVLEFLKLFNIDFVIHNPRQSILPERLLSDTDRTPMDLLKDRHINRPKHMVYETNVLNLTEKVEGLKGRMGDLDKPLKIVNRTLWEEMRNSSEKELKSFGAKLKERNNLFRKTSKVQSHEMKEVLYSNLVQANLEEQKKLRRTIEEADEMIKSLDDCICALQTELVAVEEKGFEGTPSLKSRQEEMKKVTEALADNEREISELEMQKKQNSEKVNRLKAETRNLDSHVTTLHMLNEWRFGESRDDGTVYTFLHNTFHLELVYEKYNGNVADNQPERKISQITFKHQIDVEKSQSHACLVHKLLSQYIERESAWVEKYSTSRHVPMLLHDVGLVVSRCRLLGEELRRLKMCGGLRLAILDISCVDTQVHIVFSSLKKFSKIEVIFSVSLIDHLYVLHVQSFKNMIGNITIQQIEDMVASFSPGKNLLTKVVKKIHENLC